MKIEKNKTISNSENKLHNILPKMEVGDSIFIDLAESYIDKKEILAEVREYNTANAKNLKVKIKAEEKGFRLWLVSDKPKKSQGISKKDRNIMQDFIKNEVSKMEKRLENKIKKIELT